MGISKILGLLLGLLLFVSACAPTHPPANKSPKRTATYTSSFPGRDISDKLEQLHRSIKRISATGTYQTYYFGSKRLTLDQINAGSMEDLADHKTSTQESTAGTAIIIARTNYSALLLTCNHVIDFPDTVVSYQKNPDFIKPRFVQSIAIKRRQNNLIYDLPNLGSFDIIAADSDRDLALLHVDLKTFEQLSGPAIFNYMGDSKRLKWGSFIIIMGYPKGFPMVTRGIVSDPNSSKEGDFMTDALFNPGISGAAIFASRNGFSDFEWVGVANSASADQETILIPDPLKEGLYKPLEPYYDTIFLQKRNRLSYGITQAIPTGSITAFLEDHARLISRLGFKDAVLSKR